jgi:hypothetical protein
VSFPNGPPSRRREVDISLTRIMVRAHAIRDRLLRDNGFSIDQVAREENVSPS